MNKKVCTICAAELQSPIPEKCIKCGWNLWGDITLMPAITHINKNEIQRQKHYIELVKIEWQMKLLSGSKGRYVLSKDSEIKALKDKNGRPPIIPLPLAPISPPASPPVVVANPQPPRIGLPLNRGLSEVKAVTKVDNKKDIVNINLGGKAPVPVIPGGNPPVIQVPPVLDLGEYIEFGHYCGKRILWRVFSINPLDKSLLLWSEYALCFKAFDAAEGGKAKDKEHFRSPKRCGSNKWANSNLREWLNSDSQKVNYLTYPPVMPAVLSYPYVHEEGFLFSLASGDGKILHKNERIINCFIGGLKK